MRRPRTIAMVLAMSLVAILATPPAKADVDVSFGLFYSNLSSHGSWLVSAEYGRVWQPVDYGPGWNPYYDGHWVWTDVGWTWVSDYSWGSIPYHYGTWVLDPRFGWVWVPGYTWAPSWVVFRTGPDYIGWAPVPPRFSIGASFTFGDDPDLFVFVGAGDFLASRVRTRVLPIETTRTVIRNTTIVNNISIENDIVVNRGPDVRVVERATGKRVQVTPVERVRRVGPSDRITKADLRVKRERGEPRAAEPVRADEPLPGVERSSRQDDRRGPGKAKAEPKRKADDRKGRGDATDDVSSAPSRRAEQPRVRDERATGQDDRQRERDARAERQDRDARAERQAAAERRERARGSERASPSMTRKSDTSTSRDERGSRQQVDRQRAAKANADLGRAEAQKAEARKAEARKVEAQKAEARKAEAKKAAAQKAEKKKADRKKAEEKKADEKKGDRGGGRAAA